MGTVVGVAVSVGVGMAVAVSVGVGVSVAVGGGASVAVGVHVGVTVAVGVIVSVGVMVAVGVSVMVGVRVAVAVGVVVLSGVAVGVGVSDCQASSALAPITAAINNPLLMSVITANAATNLFISPPQNTDGQDSRIPPQPKRPDPLIPPICCSYLLRTRMGRIHGFLFASSYLIR